MKLRTFCKMLLKLRSVENKMTREFEKSTGFSLTRYEILVFLEEQGASLQTDIAEYMEIDPAAITRHVRILQEKGYVNRERNSENAREIFVSLTDFAEKELKKCKEQQKKQACELPVPFTDEELENLLATIDAIEGKL